MAKAALVSWLALTLLTSSTCIAKEHIVVPLQMPNGPCCSQQAQTLSTPAAPVDANSKVIVGLALGGGGARGAAHAGVLKVLVDAGIPIQAIAGTSVGAIVGGLYCAGIRVDDLESYANDQTIMRAFISKPVIFKVATRSAKLAPSLIGHGEFEGLYKGKKFRKALETLVPENFKNVQSLQIPFCAVSFNLLDGKTYALTTGDLVCAMQASSAVPLLRNPVQTEDKLLVDGGVEDNLPVQEVRSILGANFVIAVDIDENIEAKSFDDLRNLPKIGNRLLNSELANSDATKLRLADILIHPNLDGIDLISTKKEDAQRALLAGEDAARHALPAIKAALQARGLAARSRL